MQKIAFEDRKFCQIRTLAARWDCSCGRIYDLMSKGMLRAWHPEGKASGKGMLVEVSSVLETEKNGYVTLDG